MPWRPTHAAANHRRRHVGVVLPCYNEDGNVDERHRRMAAMFDCLPQWTFEMLFIYNASTDGTVEKIRC